MLRVVDGGFLPEAVSLVHMFSFLTYFHNNLSLLFLNTLVVLFTGYSNNNNVSDVIIQQLSALFAV